MILHYLWTLESRSPLDEDCFTTNGVGHNFGSEYIFDYDDEKNVLSAKNRDDIPDDFFKSNRAGDKSHISNVTCIVGENGVGKTKLLKLVANSLPSGNVGGPMITCLIVYQTLDTMPFGEPGFHMWAYLLDLENIIAPSWIAKPAGLAVFNFDQARNNLSTILYSNIFDFDHFGEVEGLRNITTNHRLRKAPEDFLNEGSPEMFETVAHELIEVEENIYFIAFDQPTSDHRRLLPFDPPDFLQFGVLDTNIRRIGRNLSESSPLRKLFDQCKDEADNKFQKDPKDRFLTWLYLAALSSYLHDRTLQQGDTVGNSALETFGDSMLGKDKVRHYLEILQRAAPISNRGTPSQIIEFLDLMDQKVGEISTSIWFPYGNLVPFSAVRENLSSLKEILDSYKMAVTFTGFLSFHWSGLSSGQQSILTMFSRFLSLNSPKADNMELKRHLLILIDEGTEYFHPEWQRNFLKYLIDFLPFVYGAAKVIQIIVATNSPFVLSDIPSGNVIVLGKKEDQEELGLTFGANIHSLLAHGMFMKNTIGAFAEEKMQQVIDILYKKDSTTIIDRATAQKIIHLVAEPMIRGELQRKLDQGRIQELEEELRKRDAIEGERGKGDA